MIQSGLQRSGFRPKATCPKCHRTKVAIKDGKIGPHIALNGGQRCYPGEAQVIALPRQKRMKPGRKSELELKIEARYKKLFEERGITTCEVQLDGCLYNDHLSWAHIDKRDRMTLEEYLCCVVLACIDVCHNTIERLHHELMRNVVGHMIDERGWKPTIWDFEALWPEIQKTYPSLWVGEIEPIIERGASSRCLLV